MSIRQVLTNSERQHLSQSDHSYLRRKIREGCLLSELISKPYNKHLLAELLCILDKKPLPGRETGRFMMRQVGRLTDGIRHPCYRRKMTADERVRYGISMEVI